MITIRNKDTACKLCAYFEPATTACHRYPQAVPVTHNHWCGEWTRAQLSNTTAATQPTQPVIKPATTKVPNAKPSNK